MRQADLMPLGWIRCDSRERITSCVNVISSSKVIFSRLS